MTISVTIKHDTVGSPWSLKVESKNATPGGYEETGTEIKPGETKTFTVWDTRSLVISEMPTTKE